jgi:hypothetical protein
MEVRFWSNRLLSGVGEGGFKYSQIYKVYTEVEQGSRASFCSSSRRAPEPYLLTGHYCRFIRLSILRLGS